MMTHHPLHEKSLDPVAAQQHINTCEMKSQTWWCTHVIPILGKLKQEDLKVKANLSCNKFVVDLNNIREVCFRIQRVWDAGLQLSVRSLSSMTRPWVAFPTAQINT